MDGDVAPGLEAVADIFEEILAASPMRGAAFAAHADGVPVVDLWGGLADPETGSPWARDTTQLVFSGTKGLVAACVLALVERGALALEAPVRDYWPELGGEGKDALTVAHVLGHTAGLPGLRDGFAATALLDGVQMSERVAREAPFWPPGSRLAYHALTFGWLCDGLVRRVDGRSLGVFLRDEVTAPLSLDLWLGLPEELEPSVADLGLAPDYGVTALGSEPEPLLGALYGDLLRAFPWNERTFHAGEIPAANAIGTARSLSRFYACLARGGELGGVRLLSDETVRLGRSELSRGICAVTRRPYAFGVGFELQTELRSFGPPADGFGHTGSGGSVHGAWPGARVSFSFAMSELWPEARDDRARRLLAALATALA